MSVGQQLLGAGAAISLLLALLWWTRRASGLLSVAWRKPARGGRALELMERLPLTPQHSIHLVRHRDQYLLIGVHGAGLSVLYRCGEAGLAGQRLPEDGA